MSCFQICWRCNNKIAKRTTSILHFFRIEKLRNSKVFQFLSVLPKYNIDFGYKYSYFFWMNMLRYRYVQIIRHDKEKFCLIEMKKWRQIAYNKWKIWIKKAHESYLFIKKLIEKQSKSIPFHIRNDERINIFRSVKPHILSYSLTVNIPFSFLFLFWLEIFIFVGTADVLWYPYTLYIIMLVDSLMLYSQHFTVIVVEDNILHGSKEKKIISIKYIIHNTRQFFKCNLS